MRRTVWIAALLILAIAKPALAGDEYDFVLTGRSNPYWEAMAEGIKETAQARKIDAIVYEAANERDAEGELNICLAAISRKPKVIVMSSINPSIGIECFKQASAAGILVADVDGNLPVAVAAKAGIKLAFSIGSDNLEIGREAAKYTGTIAGKPDPKILILEGTAGSLNGERRVEGFRAEIQTLMPGAVIAASISAEFDRLKGLNVTADLLQRTPDVDIIYAANDEMALGAAEAVRNVGKSSHIRIVGIDGTIAARKAIGEGRLTATVAQLPYLMGKRAVEMAVDAANGGKTGLTEITPVPVLDAAMLKAGTDPLLKYVR